MVKEIYAHGLARIPHALGQLAVDAAWLVVVVRMVVAEGEYGGVSQYGLLPHLPHVYCCLA